MKRDTGNYLFYDLVKATAALPGLLIFRPKILYATEKAAKKIKGGAIIIANHFGYGDPIYLQFAFWYRRMHFVIAQEFFDSRWGWFFKAVHCIAVDRGNIGTGSIHRMIDTLKDGKLLGMFPEGHINETPDALETFKAGMVLIAQRGRKPIIPVYIKPPAHRLGRLVIVIGEKVDVESICSENAGVSALERCATLLREREEQLKRISEGGKNED